MSSDARQQEDREPNHVDGEGRMCVVAGGVNQVEIFGSTVRRPLRPSSETVQSLLGHLSSVGLQNVPRAEGIDSKNGWELVSFVDGAVFPNPALDEWRTSQALESAARLLRSYHDASRSFVPDSNAVWGLERWEPYEVICHGDFAPYNCTMVNGRVAGLFDFDTAHPGPWIEDLAYAAYRFCPLMHPNNPDAFGTLQEQRDRVRRFVESYGEVVTPELFASCCERLQRLVDHILSRSDEGVEAFSQHIRDGHIQLYERDILYIKENSSYLAAQVE